MADPTLAMVQALLDRRIHQKPRYDPYPRPQPKLTKIQRTNNTNEVNKAIATMLKAKQMMAEALNVLDDPAHAQANFRLGTLCDANRVGAFWDPNTQRTMNICCVEAAAHGDDQIGTDIPHNYTVGAHGRPLCKECQPHLNLHALKKDDDNARQAIYETATALRDVAGNDVALPGAVVRFVVAGKAKNMKAAGNDNAHAGDHAQPR
jgi:hypothetical protein